MDVFGSPVTNNGAQPNIRVSSEVRSKLPDILHGVIYNTDEDRMHNCDVLRSFIVSQATELKEEQSSYPIIEYITAEIQQALTSNDPNHVLGGIVVIDILLHFSNEIHQDGFVPSWKGLLQSTMKKSAYKVVVKAATKTLAHLVSMHPGTLSRKTISFEITTALEGIEGNSAIRRRISLVVLKNLLKEVPNIINVREVEAFSTVMWVALSDPDEKIRRSTSHVLKWVLIFIAARENHNNLYNTISDEIVKNLTIERQDAKLHGTLLALSTLIENVDGFLSKRFDEVTEAVLHLKDHKTIPIKRAVMSIVPRLAKLNPERFAEKHLRSLADYLVANLGKERSTCLIAIGELSTVLGEKVFSLVFSTFDLVVLPLFSSPSWKQVQPVLPSAYEFIISVVQALGESVATQISTIVSALSDLHFSEGLLKALRVVMKNISAPAVRKKINSYLIRTARQILVVPSSYDSSKRKPEEAQVILAMNVFVKFSFSPPECRDLLIYIGEHYLSNPNITIRKSAAKAIAKRIVLPEGPLPDASLKTYSGLVVKKLLHTLLNASMSDADTGFRLKILKWLDSRYDRWLSQPEFIKIFLMFLKDSSVDVQARALSLLGRLSHANPGFIFPQFRTILVDYLRTLKCPGNFGQRENSAFMLSLLLKNFSPLLKPYTIPIITTLIDTLRAPKVPSNIAHHCISAVGNLVIYTGNELRDYTKELMAIVRDNFQDRKPSKKRAAALDTLGRLITCTGYAVDPLESYPTLLDLLFEKIETATPHERRKLLRLLGIIGAIDPYRYKTLHLERLENEGGGKAEMKLDTEFLSPPEQESMLKDFFHSMTPQSEDYYPTVVLDLLMRFLKNPLGPIAHLLREVVTSLMTIFKSMNLRCLPYLEVFMPPLIDVMKNCGDSTPGLCELIFQQLGVLVSILKRHTRDYLPVLIDLMKEYWNKSAHGKLQDFIISLLEKISMVLVDEFADCLSQFLPKLLETIYTKHTRSVKVLHAFRLFGTALDCHLHLVVPATVELVIPSDGCYEISLEAIKTLNHMAHIHDIEEFCLIIFRVLSQAIEFPVLTVEALNAATSILTVLSPESPREVYIEMIQRALKRPPRTRNSSNGTPRVERALSTSSSTVDTTSDLSPRATSSISGTESESTKIVLVSHSVGSSPQTALSALHGMASETPITLSGSSVDSPRSKEAPRLADALSAFLNVASDITNGNKVERIPPKTFRLPQSVPQSEKGSPTVPHKTSSSLSDDEAKVSKGNEANFDALVTVWDISQICTEEDWWEWIQRVSLTFLRESPSPAIRCMTNLAMNHPPLAHQLLNVAFLSCWEQLNHKQQLYMVQKIELVLSCSTVEAKILHILLDLAEFMERSEKDLPLDIGSLGRLAQHSNAFAKALYYLEKEHKQNPTAKIADLITVNDHLGQHEAANGLIAVAQRDYGIEIDITWYEKLQQWITGLEAYEARQIQKPDDMDIMLGRMRCLKHLGYWNKLESLTQTAYKFAEGNEVLCEKIAMYALNASFNLGNFDLGSHLKYLHNSKQYNFYKAIVNIQQGSYNVAKKHISKARDFLAPELTALVGESYSRAYTTIVASQQLSELEEIIEYKKHMEADDKEKMQITHDLWNARLQLVEHSVDTWQSILSCRSLVPPSQDSKHWVKFANLVRKSMRFRRAKNIINCLVVFSDEISEDGETKKVDLSCDPYVHYSYLKLLREVKSSRVHAYSALLRWVNAFSIPGVGSKVDERQKARCYSRLALWKLQHCEDKGSFDEKEIPAMIDHCKLAIEHNKDWQKAWHIWATIHYKVLSNYSKHQDHRLFLHLLPAINGFIRSISLAKSENVQDTLGLLTLWFNFGYKKEIDKAVREGFEDINVDTWLPVIPQIIARLHMRNIKAGIDQLLNMILKHHVQALVFPITVAHKSETRTRRQSALTVMNAMKQQNSALVQEALLVSNELIRFSILWKEKWRRGLDDAYRHYLDRNIHSMMLVLLPLHEMINAGASTPNEQLFISSFGKDLEKAWNCCKEYAKTRNDACLQLAWDLYAHVFRILQRQLQVNEFEKLHLSHFSPELEKVNNLELVIPGTYIESYLAKKPLVRIARFAPMLKVIPSKQRPRKLVIHGSDGKDYPFLLKGNEDLRQDARVMQLFELVNDLLSVDSITAHKHISIQCFSVTPLSSDSGLIKWIPHSDTFHELIRIYRAAHDIPIDIEITHLNRFAQTEEYAKLPVMNKLEYFENALEETSGEDLAKIFWLNSKNAELWLDKRTTYTQSLAVMSMVGYILGLGDRHPNNLMINRNSGKVIHIDFGDCFEVSMHRDRYAERVPFRLTRMLTNAMGISGVEGHFRITAEHVMRVLRTNKEPIMAILEAFVYDPLVNWGLNKEQEEATPSVSAMGSLFEPSLIDVLASMKPTPTQNEEEPVGPNGPYYPQRPPILQPVALPVPSHAFGGLGGETTTVHPGHSVEGTGENQKALHVLERVEDKLSGYDFRKDKSLDVDQQVDLLIAQARSNVNLCQAYLPWCPFW
eukprot:TRINITY_DN7809_c0_g1_i1.p1 TRINITY_DN7809_c0_g1~~TRINITY_DN7809_c0_g1_i1.p1  ORF type:complete len:2505 (+),score=361.67 TRINITY_DN7809_c0_g1_i1:42-7556(+)